MAGGGRSIRTGRMTKRTSTCLTVCSMVSADPQPLALLMNYQGLPNKQQQGVLSEFCHGNASIAQAVCANLFCSLLRCLGNRSTQIKHGNTDVLGRTVSWELSNSFAIARACNFSCYPRSTTVSDCAGRLADRSHLPRSIPAPDCVILRPPSRPGAPAKVVAAGVTVASA